MNVGLSAQGLGDTNFAFAVYIANRPNMLEYQQLSTITPLVSGEVNAINQACGNGWRKVFNVYAKLLYALDKSLYPYSKSASTWQKYRDEFLLQADSKTALLFSLPILSVNDNIPSNKSNGNNCNTVHIICGKTYAKNLLNDASMSTTLTWLDDEFAIDHQNKLVVCPYFDYRQLSNVKIDKLAKLLAEIQRK